MLDTIFIRPFRILHDILRGILHLVPYLATLLLIWLPFYFAGWGSADFWRDLVAYLPFTNWPVTQQARAAEARLATEIATPVAGMATAEATAWAVLATRQALLNEAATAVAQAGEKLSAAQATAAAAIATARAVSLDAAQAQATATKQDALAEAAILSARRAVQEAESSFQGIEQSLAQDHNSILAIPKARQFGLDIRFLIRLEPYVEGRSLVEILQHDQLLDWRQVANKAQLHDLLSQLGLDEAVTTRVTVRFSPHSSDNHRAWIREFLDRYQIQSEWVEEEE